MPRILIADDSRFQLALLKDGLLARGFEVVSAQDALQASMMARRTTPDAMVLDLSMPGGSGFEVVKRLRGSSKTRVIPIIILTASSDPSVRETAISLGVSEFFQKPVDLDELACKLSDLCAPPKSRNIATELSASEPSPICGKEQVTSESNAKPSRSWREILQEVAKKEH